MADLIYRVESFPFDSRADGYDDDGYPVYDRAVGAGILRKTFEQFFSDGVFPRPGDALQVSKGETGLTVTVNPGVFIVRGAMGAVTEEMTVQLSASAPAGNMAYGIMLRYDENDNTSNGQSVGRSLSIRVSDGAAGSTPTPPNPDQSTPGVWEYRLATVTVPNGATDMTGASVTNEKGLEVCPYAAPFEEIDLSGVVEDARAQAQEATDAFLVYAQKYYDLVASAIDGTTAGELMEAINSISAASFVDNVTLSLDSNAKAQVKDQGVTDRKIATYNVHQEHLDNFLRQKLGLLDPTSWSAQEFRDYVADLSVDDQASFIEGDMQASMISSWTDSDVQQFDALLKGDEPASKFVEIWDLSDISWGNLDSRARSMSTHPGALSALVGKEKSASCGTYGERSFRVIGVDHDELSDGSGTAPLTFECTTVLFSVSDLGVDNTLSSLYEGDTSQISAGKAAAWPTCKVRTYLRDTVMGQLPSDLKSSIRTVKKRSSGGSQMTQGNTRPEDDGLFYAETDETLFLVSIYETLGDVFQNQSYGYRIYSPLDGDTYDYWSTNGTYGAALDADMGGSGINYKGRFTRSFNQSALQIYQANNQVCNMTFYSMSDRLPKVAPAFCI